MRWLWGLSAFLVLTATTPALAEEGDSRAIQKGRYSLALTLPDGGGTSFGVWKMITTRSNLGLTLGINHEFRRSTEGPDTLRDEFGSGFWSFSFGPSLERYLVVRRSVSPFVFGSLSGSYLWSKGLYRRAATLAWGLGADWTPLESVSIGGSTGISWTEAMESRSDFGAPKQSSSSFNTMASALTLHLYF
jgi:hypothetical protein